MNTRKLLVASFALIGLIGGIGFAPRAAHTAHAATAGSLPASQVLGGETASLLGQTLDAVQSFLNVVSVRANDTTRPMTDGEKTAMSNVLESLRVSLTQIGVTVNALDAKAVAVANGNGGQVLGQGKVPSPAPVASAPSAPHTVGTAPSDGTNLSADNGTGINPNQAANNEDQTASAQNLFGGKKGWIWGGAALLVLIAGVTLVSRKGTTSGSRGAGGHELMKKEVAQPVVVQPVAHPVVTQPMAQPSTQPATAAAATTPATAPTQQG
jgi:hypothetical protein